MKIFKALFFVLASALMMATLIAIPEISGSVSVAYISVLGIYLGLDVALMISKTAGLPKGEFKPMSFWKYCLTGFCIAALSICCIILRKKGIDVTTSAASFISAFMIILGCLIGGLEGNHIATSKGGE